MLKFATQAVKKYKNLSVMKKAVLWYTFATIIQNGILFLITPLYTRLLSDSQYGVFSVYQSWQQIVSILSVLALDRCITVGFMKYEENRNEFLSAIQGLMTILVIGFTALAIIFSEYLEKIIGLHIYIIVAMLIVSLMNNTLANWTWFQRYQYNYIKLTGVTIFSTFIMQIIALLAIKYLPFDNKGEILILSMSSVRLLIYGIIYCSVFCMGRIFYNKEYWKFALNYSIAVVPHALAQIVLNSSDRIMIDKICGRSEAAYYGVTYTAAMVLNIIMTSITSAVQPWFYEKIKCKDYDNIRKQTNRLLIVAAMFSIGVSFFAPEILSILAPPSYRVALWIFPSVAVSVYFNTMYLCFANFESYYEKPIYFSIATTIGAFVNIILNLLLIPLLGFVVAGYTTLFCYMLFALMHYIFMKRICKEKLDNVDIFDKKFIFGLSIIVLILSLGITVLYEYVVVRYVCIGFTVVFGIVYRKKLLDELKKILMKKSK